MQLFSDEDDLHGWFHSRINALSVGIFAQTTPFFFWKRYSVYYMYFFAVHTYVCIYVELTPSLSNPQRPHQWLVFLTYQVCGTRPPVSCRGSVSSSEDICNRFHLLVVLRKNHQIPVYIWEKLQTDLTVFTQLIRRSCPAHFIESYLTERVIMSILFPGLLVSTELNQGVWRNIGWTGQ